jgi:hypothetical protein
MRGGLAYPACSNGIADQISRERFLMNFGKWTVGVCLGILLVAFAGCASKPSKAEVEKRVREALTASSGEWKDIKYDTRANDTVSVVLATRSVNGKPHEYSFTGGSGSGGVAVRAIGGDWLAKYRYEKDKEVESSKMKGTDEDVNTFRPTAAELAAVAIKVCP